MHELSIALSVVEAVTDCAAEHHATGVTRVRLRVGELSAVDPDALEFAFQAVTAENPLFSGCQLEVEWVPIRVFCPVCGREGPALPRSVLCAGCGNRLTRVVAGEELDIATVEVAQDVDRGGGRSQDPVPE